MAKKNTLATRYPEVASEWDYEKNHNYSPEDVSPKSKKKVWWICSKKHSWIACVGDRTHKKSKCPYCSHSKASEDYNLKVKYPDVAKEWHPTKNLDLLPNQFTPYSRKVIWWKCSKSDSHVWKTSIGNRTGKEATGCPFCSGRYPEKGKSLGDLFPKLVKEWDVEKNGKLDPFNLACRTSRKVWWICASGHSWSSAIAERAKENPRTCPTCQSFGSRSPELAKLWHPTKNNKTPFDYKPFSDVKIWWECNEGHPPYEQTINSKSSGQRCPRCAGNLPSDNNNLLYLYPDICKEWDYTKNKKQPSEYTAHSNKKVWWICSKDPEHKWPAIIDNRTRAGSRCPHCNNTQTSRVEIRIYCELKPIFENIKWRHIQMYKNKKYECDLYIPEENIAIEIDGAYWHKNKLKKDKKKNEILKKSGIKLIRIREQPLECLSSSDISYKNHDKKLDVVSRLAEVLCRNVKNEKARSKLKSYIKSNKYTNEKEYKKIISYLPGPIPEKSLEKTHPELAKEWDYEKNYPMTPSMITYGTTRKMFWKCKNGHSWDAAVGSRTIHGRGCRKCHLEKKTIGYKRVSKSKSLGALYPTIAEDWSEENTVTPYEVTPRSKLEVKWRCRNGHTWESKIDTRFALKYGCVECFKNKKKLGFKKVAKDKSLGVLNKELLKEWDEKNPMSPFEISSGSHYKAKWICKKCNQKWPAVIANRTTKNSGCPKCYSLSRKVSHKIVEP